MKVLLALSSMIFCGYSTFLLLEQNYVWLLVWVISSLVLRQTIKQDILEVIKKEEL